MLCFGALGRPCDCGAKMLQYAVPHAIKIQPQQLHLLKPLLESAEPGTAMFKLISPDDAVKKLRQLLSAVGVRDARLYRPHDLRRGHAEDLRLEGAPLWKILAAGEWRSAAFQAYLGLHKLDVDDALSGALDDESDDDIEP